MKDLVIALSGVSKCYGRVVGLNGVDLEVREGITALLGPNGAGKSTLLKLVTGQLRPTLGEVRVFGRRVWRSAAARRRIGFAPDADAFYEEMRVREFVLAMARLSGLSAGAARRTDEVLDRCGMAENASKRLGACSKGMRQRVKLAQALVHDPELVVLDEPLTGIDAPGRREMLDLFAELRREGKTVLLSTHVLSEVESHADRLVVVARGRVLAAGSLGEIRSVLSEHPLSVRIVCERPRSLGARLLGGGLVTSASVEDANGAAAEAAVRLGEPRDANPSGGGARGALTVRIASAEAFFRSFPQAVLDEGGEVERVEALDASAEAVFEYLLRRESWLPVDAST
jgi:ABC-2 type transport system ATP-binding protein